MVIRNRFRVPAKQWGRWSRAARSTFNDTYATLGSQAVINSAPRAPQLPKTEWQVVRWNAAWVAADAVRDFERVAA